MYENGVGVERNYEKAIELYEKAIELGNSIAMNNLGNIYKSGTLVKQDYEKAIELYEKAIELGDNDAIYNLGIIYYYHITDNGKALKLLIDAYNKGIGTFFHIENLMKRNYKLILNIIKEKDQNINQLVQINNQLKDINDQLMYFPGGVGYYECKSHFTDCLNNNN